MWEQGHHYKKNPLSFLSLSVPGKEPWKHENAAIYLPEKEIIFLETIQGGFEYSLKSMRKLISIVWASKFVWYFVF